MEEKSHLTPNNGESFIRVEKLNTKPKKSCLFKVLAGLLFVFIGLPVIAVLIMTPVKTKSIRLKMTHNTL